MYVFAYLKRTQKSVHVCTRRRSVHVCMLYSEYTRSILGVYSDYTRSILGVYSEYTWSILRGIIAWPTYAPSMVRPTEKNSRHEGRSDQLQLRHCDDDQLPFEHLEELLQSVATGLRPAFKPGGLPAPTLRSTTLGDKFPLAGRWWAAFSRRPVSVSRLRARGRHAS